MGDKEQVHPLHVLVVGLKWPPETFLNRLLKGLLKSGVHITVATSRKPSSEWFAFDNFAWLWQPAWHGQKILRLVRLGYLVLQGLMQSPKLLYRLCQQISPQPLVVWNSLLPLLQFRGDVIYVPWTSVMSALTQLGCPVVISCRGSQINVYPHDPGQSYYRKQLPLMFARVTAVHCVSEAIKLETMKYGLDPQKAHVIYPAVDPDFFQPANQSEDTTPFRIIMTGALRWVKGYEFALLAVKKLVDAQLPVQLDIIGCGPERQRVLYTIEDLNLWQVVQLHGQLTPEQVREKLQQSHLFLLSSLSEGVSNAVLEAMACGLPVVTTDCGGMREAVTDGVEGFVVPIYAPDIMAEKIVLLANDPALRQQMGQAARQRIQQAFTLTQQSQQFRKLWQQSTTCFIP